MSVRLRWWPVVLVIAGASVAPASAQILSYDNDSQRAGASMVTTFGYQEIAKRNMEYCAGAYPEMAWDAHAAYAGWVRHNAVYLQVASGIRRSLAGFVAKDNTEQGILAKKMLEEYLPTQINRLAETQVQALRDMPSPDVRRRMCSNLIAAVNAGKPEVETSDPEIGRFLKAQAVKHGVNAAPESAAAAPGARTDADALVGRWRSEKARQYLSDGTVREGSGGCTSEFLAQRLTTECSRPDGKTLRVVYSFKLLAPGRFELQMVENAAFPQFVGTRTLGAFRVEDDKLITSAYPSPANAEATRPVQVEAVYVRDPGTPRSPP